MDIQKPYVPNKTNSHIAVETLGSSYQDSDGSSSYPRKGPLTLAVGVGFGT